MVYWTISIRCSIYSDITARMSSSTSKQQPFPLYKKICTTAALSARPMPIYNAETSSHKYCIWHHASTPPWPVRRPVASSVSFIIDRYLPIFCQLSKSSIREWTYVTTTVTYERTTPSYIVVRRRSTELQKRLWTNPTSIFILFKVAGEVAFFYSENPYQPFTTF